MLNTDAHNKMVKNKMSRQDFIRNNRGMNDGQDFPAEYLSALYDRIVSNEIKMRGEDEPEAGRAGGDDGRNAITLLNKMFLDTMLGLLGRKGQTPEESEAKVRRLHDHLKELAAGAEFIKVEEPEAIRPLLGVLWTPITETLLALYEEHENPKVVDLCARGLKAAACLVAGARMERHRRFLVHVLARYSLIHFPTAMRHKSLPAIRAVLGIAEAQGNYLGDSWPEVLRFISRLDALHALGVQGAPVDAILFGGSGKSSFIEKKTFFGFTKKVQAALTPARTWTGGDPYRSLGAVDFADSGLILKLPLAHEVAEAPEGAESVAQLPGPALDDMDVVLNPRELEGVAKEVLRNIDPADLTRIYQRTALLDSDAIVEFVQGLCQVASEELASTSSLRVYSLAKIVEVSMYNTARIRLVWQKIWGALAEFFGRVGSSPNIPVAMYAIDCLRQMTTRSLEREELCNFSFQNDFMRPFVTIMKSSPSAEVREMIIRAVSQMVLNKVSSVKSGWKVVLQVFTVAAHDSNQNIVKLAFETIEKMVREHFRDIVATEAVTFTDLVNALIAFTGNQAHPEVALNAIAFLRYCAIMLAEGVLGKAVDELPPEDADGSLDHPALRHTSEGGSAAAARPASPQSAHVPGPGDGVVGAARSYTTFTDKDAHMYFWIPLLAGLSELGLDPRPDIRRSALGVLFDILKYHGPAFSASFWVKVLDSVLFPIFDSTRAAASSLMDEPEASEVAASPGIGKFRRQQKQQAKEQAAAVDQYLYDTCSICLGTFVEVFGQFFPKVESQLPRFLVVLSGLLQRPHEQLAALVLSNMIKLVTSTGKMFSEVDWEATFRALGSLGDQVWPDIRTLAFAAVEMGGKGKLGKLAGRFKGLAGVKGQLTNLTKSVAVRQRPCTKLPVASWLTSVSPGRLRQARPFHHLVAHAGRGAQPDASGQGPVRALGPQVGNQACRGRGGQ